MRIHTIFFGLLLVLPIGLFAQTSPPSDSNLGFDLTKRLADSAYPNNVIIAPHLIRTALAAVATGAEGETQQQILALSGDYTSIDHRQLDSAHTAMDIWVAPTGKLLPSFAAGLPTLRVESTSPAIAPASINAFISSHTNGMIRNVVQTVPPDGVILTTALYFKGTWRNPFDKGYTKQEPFHLSDGKTKDVAMMSKWHNFRYVENADGQLIQIPYTGNDYLVLTVFLPRPQLGARAWLAGMSGASWQAMLRNVDYRYGHLQLPRLDASYTASLVDNLKALGMQRAFKPNAQFNGILHDAPVSITDVLQRSVFTLDEVSTEAAAAVLIVAEQTTAPVPDPNAAPPPPPFVMTVDRPYFLTIGDPDNKRILFAGMINAPN